MPVGTLGTKKKNVSRRIVVKERCKTFKSLSWERSTIKIFYKGRNLFPAFENKRTFAPAPLFLLCNVFSQRRAPCFRKPKKKKRKGPFPREKASCWCFATPALSEDFLEEIKCNGPLPPKAQESPPRPGYMFFRNEAHRKIFWLCLG